MKKTFFYTFTALFMIFLLNPLESQVHFTGYTENTGTNLTLVVPTDANPMIGTDPLVAGDEIGVFTPGGLLVGAGVWDELNNIAITVWGDNNQTQAIDGMQVGETLNFRVWDSQNNIELTSVTVSYLLGTGTYTDNGFYVLSSLVAAKKPGKASFTNPVNNATTVALNGNLSWNVAAGATTHTIQLSAASNFSGLIINSTGNISSISYSNLSNNTMYYARVRGTNSEGDGEWETISFKTLLATPVLANPADNLKGQNESSVNLSWNSVTGATSYTVQLATNNTFTTGLVEQTVGVTNATFNGLSVFTDYYWRVMAKDGSNTSAYSSIRTFKTRVGTTTITNPSNNATGVALSGNLVWSAVTGATSYDVQLVKLSPLTTVISNNVAGTSVAYSNLENYTNYEVRVTAKNADGSGSQVTSTFRTILGIPALQTPANNSYNNPLTGNLTWNAVTGATAYDLRLATDNGFTNIISTQTDIAGTTAAYNVPSNNQRYYWQVRAKNTEGTSDYSTAYSFTSELLPATLISPSNNATQVSFNPVLQWNAAPGATSYQVQVSSNNTFTAIVSDNSPVNTTTLQINNLSSKTTYYWRVRGYNANSNGVFTSSFSFTTMLGKVSLNSPLNGAQGIIAASGTLNWNTMNGATSYDLLISQNSDLSSPVVNTNVAGNSYNYAGLSNNSTYYWAVRAKDSEGTGSWSDTWSFGTQIPAPTLLTPANNATNIGLIGSCTWTSVAEANTYQLQIATDNSFTNILFNQSGIVGTTGNYTGLDNNKTHYWRVRAYKGSGAGLWSSVFQFQTITLAPPTPIFPPNNAIDLYTSITFAWNPVAQATGYNFRYATDPGMINVLQTVNNIAGTQHTLTGLFVERDYYWQVQTIGAQGVSNWSSAQKLTTIYPIEINGSTEVCENKPATYTTRVSPLVDYQWTVTGGTISGSNTSNSVTVNWGAAGSGTVTLKRTSSVWGNYTDNQTLNVTKNSVANVIVTLNANTHYPGYACRNEIVNLSAAVNSNGVFTYEWKLNNTVVSTQQSFNYHFTTAGTYTFNFKATGLDCEAGSSSITIEVNPDCPVTIINDDVVYTCKNGSPVLTSTAIGGSGQFTYSWSPSTDFVNANISSPVVKSAIYSKNFYLTVVDIVSGTNYSDLLTMSVYESPSVSFSPASKTVYNGNAIDLTNPAFVTVNITNGQAPYTQNWTDNLGNPIDPTNVYPNLGTNRYWLTVNDANGCASVAKRFTVVRSSMKDGQMDLTVGLTGEGIVYTYPNPVVNELNIIADFESMQNVSISIVNLLGMEVQRYNLGTIDSYEGNLNLVNLVSGYYTLIIESDGNIFAKPFMKQ